MTDHDAVVIGGGISGASFAFHAAQAGCRVLVVERDLEPGGCLHSVRAPTGFWFELGAHTCYSSYGAASVDSPAADGGPRRVKTLMVRPDGTVVPPAPGAAPVAGAPAAAPQQAASAGATPAAPPAQAQAAAPPPAAAPQQAAAAPEQVAAIPQAQAAPKPAPKPAAKKAPSSYVVQVGSRKNQTEALATFADMQQKYPSLLGSYRPMVQKADLGSKGVWYRLRIGPIGDKSEASKLCSKLKSQGLPDCLVMAK